MGAAEVMVDQPRDIHGTPLYVGDRVAIAEAAFVGFCDAGTPLLIVRRVEAIYDDFGGLVVVNECDGLGGSYGFEDARSRFLRLP